MAKTYQHDIDLEDDEVEVNLDWQPPKKDGEDDLKIEVEGEEAAPKEPGVEAPEADDPPKPPPVRGPDPEILRLQEEVRRMREEQARRDRLAEEGYQQFEGQQIDQKIHAAREKYKKAQETGDTEAALAAMDEITDLKVEKKARSLAPRPEPKADPAPQPPQNPLTSRWMGANPWFGQREYAAETLAVRAIDTEMVAEGWQPNTEDYFEEMNRRLGKKFKSVEVGSISTKKKSPLPPTAAPKAPKTQVRPGVVKLTRQDFETMRIVGMDPNNPKDRVAFAKQKVAYQD